MLDIKAMYNAVVARQPTIAPPSLTPLQEIEEREKRRLPDLDAPNGLFAGQTLGPSPALITSIVPGRINATISYNASSGEGYEDGHTVDYAMLIVTYDIAFDASLYANVRVIHNHTLVQVGGEILDFGYDRSDN